MTWDTCAESELTLNRHCSEAAEAMRRYSGRAWESTSTGYPQSLRVMFGAVDAFGGRHGHMIGLACLFWLLRFAANFVCSRR